MAKFRVGQKVKVAKAQHVDKRDLIGTELEITELDGEFYNPTEQAYLVSQSPYRWRESELVAQTSLIRIRRFIEDGIYDGINISDHRDGSVKVRMHMGDEGRRYTKAELDRALLILSQLAEFLDEDKGDE